MTKRDYHDVLGLSSDATLNEVKKAFRRIAMQLHPDHGGDAKAFAELKNAFEQAVLVAPKVAHVRSQKQANRTATQTSYDPFTDSDYESYVFFEPHDDKIADFERHAYAGQCPYCGGRGKITKLVYPEKGFLGREERFCICQKVGIIKS